MQEIGNYNGPDPLRTDEEKTHWGLWVVISSPLILGLDMSQQATMDRCVVPDRNLGHQLVLVGWSCRP